MKRKKATIIISALSIFVVVVATVSFFLFSPRAGSSIENPQKVPEFQGSRTRVFEGFQGAKWGMPSHEVQAIFSHPELFNDKMTNTGSEFMFYGNLMGYSTSNFFKFYEEELFFIAISLDQFDDNFQEKVIDYEEAYLEFKDFLITKYGKPDISSDDTTQKSNVWHLKETQVRLKWTIETSDDPDYMSLIYQDVSRTRKREKCWVTSKKNLMDFGALNGEVRGRK